ncbi:hypothetical protein [Rubellimicrobium aerolatum]|uniref:HEAT repeat domain-containing protein n=1 Tax=Rubellimicrobium aerolatum TaxID=490979 RepID=A0ABW0SGQ4_9RHOB|nr:hypothetical protein [Rubellimicrobium aerolatum]MBP1807655.1 hypothetical protein [Rubellimicrobium aerolatum]
MPEEMDPVGQLGTLIVQQLEREGETDLLARWMAFHVANLMKRADQGGEGVELARAACREAILALWQHRAALPGRTDPLVDVAKVIGTLHRLNSPSADWLTTRMETQAASGGVELWLQRARNLKTAHGVLLRAIATVAIQAATTDETKALLNKAQDRLQDPAVRAAALVLGWVDNREREEPELAHLVEQATRSIRDIADALLSVLPGNPPNDTKEG